MVGGQGCLNGSHYHWDFTYFGGIMIDKIMAEFDEKFLPIIEDPAHLRGYMENDYTIGLVISDNLPSLAMFILRSITLIISRESPSVIIASCKKSRVSAAPLN